MQRHVLTLCYRRTREGIYQWKKYKSSKRTANPSIKWCLLRYGKRFAQQSKMPKTLPPLTALWPLTTAPASPQK